MAATPLVIATPLVDRDTYVKARGQLHELVRHLSSSSNLNDRTRQRGAPLHIRRDLNDSKSEILVDQIVAFRQICETQHLSVAEHWMHLQRFFGTTAKAKQRSINADFLIPQFEADIDFVRWQLAFSLLRRIAFTHSSRPIMVNVRKIAQDVVAFQQKVKTNHPPTVLEALLLDTSLFSLHKELLDTYNRDYDWQMDWKLLGGFKDALEGVARLMCGPPSVQNLPTAILLRCLTAMQSQIAELGATSAAKLSTELDFSLKELGTVNLDLEKQMPLLFRNNFQSRSGTMAVIPVLKCLVALRFRLYHHGDGRDSTEFVETSIAFLQKNISAIPVNKNNTIPIVAILHNMMNEVTILDVMTGEARKASWSASRLSEVSLPIYKACLNPVSGISLRDCSPELWYLLELSSQRRPTMFQQWNLVKRVLTGMEKHYALLLKSPNQPDSDAIYDGHIVYAIFDAALTRDDHLESSYAVGNWMYSPVKWLLLPLCQELMQTPDHKIQHDLVLRALAVLGKPKKPETDVILYRRQQNFANPNFRPTAVSRGFPQDAPHVLLQNAMRNRL